MAQPVGARPLALGTSYVALSDDSLACLWNPAGLMQLRGAEMEFIYEQAPGELSFSHLLYGQPLVLGQALGAAIGTLQTADIDYRDLVGNPQTLTGQSDWVLAAGYSVSLVPLLSAPDPQSLSLSGGLTLKYLWTKLGGGLSGQAPAADLGFLATIPLTGGIQPLRIGAVWQNMGGRMKVAGKADAMASPLRLGVAQSFVESRETWTTGTVECIRMLTRSEIEMHMGVEQAWKPPGAAGVALRLGYRLNTDMPGISGGMGVRWDRYVVEYSLSQVGELGLVQRIGLRIDF